MQKKWVIGVFIATSVIAAFAVALSLACSIKTVNVNILTGGYRDEAIRSVASTGKNIHGKSIFFLNEEKFAAQVEADFSAQVERELAAGILDTAIGLEVISIERVFPATVNVHAVTKYAHAYIACDDGYAVVDNDLRVLRMAAAPQDLIEIMLPAGVKVRSHEIGSVIVLSDPTVTTVADELFYALAACGYDTFDCVTLLDRIRIDIRTDVVTLFTSAPDGNGSEIVIDGTDRLREKVRHGISVYVQDNSKRTGNRIRVYTYGGQLRVTAEKLS